MEGFLMKRWNAFIELIRATIDLKVKGISNKEKALKMGYAEQASNMKCKGEQS